ncbi:hypothetical protein LTR37_005242 [Vermiconidia calcicola]|uniref:Uncharacterized protein n=1 Tax=Vermiconidia calcicola TaxID=1690605 RepID=A0ACC3NJR9_9PEZI|nr:hypothetical protein LTR37_005242 [Vermiconidia calcicola]
MDTSEQDMSGQEEQARPLSELQAHLKSSATHCDDIEAGSSRVPLIEQAANGWQDDKPIYRSHFTDDRDLRHSGYQDRPYLIRAATSRRYRRMLLIVVLLLSLSFWRWSWCLRPQLEEDTEHKQGFFAQGDETYDTAKGNHFDGVRMQELDARLLPGGKHDPEGKRRLIFVGDIHGCAHELKKLLKHVDFDEKTDHLIAVGDVVSKGPDNVGVLDELIRLGASSVRGNHEDRLLAMAPSVFSSGSPSLPEGVSSKRSEKDEKLLRQLSKHHLKYLHDMPLMLQIPELPMASKATHKTSSPLSEEILVVHAGLVPAVSLFKQDPYYVMNMRSIRKKTHLPLAEADAKQSSPWHNVWGWYNDRLFRKKSTKDFRILVSSDADSDIDALAFGSWLDVLRLRKKDRWPKPQTVVYGHHSKAGLQLHRWSKGLDTGCVRGGELTALVLDARGEQEIVSVDCKDHR